jgi:hypothetical protein
VEPLIRTITRHLRATFVPPAEKEQFTRLFIKCLIVMGADLSAPMIHNSFAEFGGVREEKEPRGGIVPMGLDSHIVIHALEGNWKKVKNCLKTYSK